MDSNILRKIQKIEKEPMNTFNNIYSIDYEPNINEVECFLYHGLRNQKDYEKLESILKQRKIYAGIYLENYSNYSDNCNDGRFVSLINYSDSIEFEEFINKNICLIISPLCNAYKTKYLTFHEWNYIKENNISLKNRYSYAIDEYQVKDFIPIEMIRAIGIPYSNIKLTKGVEAAEKCKQDIIELLMNYEIKIPIVNINYYNRILYNPTESCKKYCTKKRIML